MQLFKNVSVTKKMLAMFLAFCCVCGVLSVPVSASAAVDNSTVATVEPRRTTIYPSSGQSSGYFFEVKSQTATYISRSLSYIIFYFFIILLTSSIIA